MGKLKRKCESFSSVDSNTFSYSNSGSSKRSSELSSASSSNLSGVPRYFASKKIRHRSSASQSSSNAGSQLSEIFAKLAYEAKSEESKRNAIEDNTNTQLPFSFQSIQNNSQILKILTQNDCCTVLSPKSSPQFNHNKNHPDKELFYHSTPKQGSSKSKFFDDPIDVDSIKEHFSQLTEEMSVSKDTSCSENHVEKVDEFEFGETVSEHFRKEISDISISQSEFENTNTTRDTLSEDIFKTNKPELKEAEGNFIPLHADVKCTESTPHFEEYLNTEKGNGLEYNTTLNEHFRININAFSTLENEHEDTNNTNDTLSEDIFKLNKPTDSKANTEIKHPEIVSNSSILNDIDRYLEADIECAQSESNFAEYMNAKKSRSKNVNIHSISSKQEDMNSTRHTISQDIFKQNQPTDITTHTELQYPENVNQNNCLFLNNLEHSQDVDKCTQSEANFEQYLSDISIHSLQKITEFENVFFDQEAILRETSPITNDIEQILNTSSKSDALSTGSNLSEASKRLRSGLNEISQDKSLIYVGAKVELNASMATQKKELIQSKICQILKWFIRKITAQESPVFKVRSMTWSNCIFENDILKLKPHQDSTFSKIIYVRANSRQNFMLILYLLMKIYILLENKSYCTQREIYYQIKRFLSSQILIQYAMNTISSMLDIEPWYFPIVTTSKGLVFGDLTVIISDEEIIRCNAIGGTLIPQDVSKIREFKSQAFFILVVEKDAIFKKLLEEGVHTKLTRPFIIITGKGYPDINTRVFLKKLWMCLRIPVFMLVDADPDGIDIMLNYRFGSKRMAHLSEELAIPQIRWLGLFPSEINTYDITHMPLNDKERKKIKDMLQRPYVNENPWLKNELQFLQKNDFKAEIEGVIKNTTFLTNVYLPAKFFGRDYF